MARLGAEAMRLVAPKSRRFKLLEIEPRRLIVPLRDRKAGGGGLSPEWAWDSACSSEKEDESKEVGTQLAMGRKPWQGSAMKASKTTSSVRER